MISISETSKKRVKIREYAPKTIFTLVLKLRGDLEQNFPIFEICQERFRKISRAGA